MDNPNVPGQEAPVKRTVLDYDDIVKMAPFLKGKRRLVGWLMKLLAARRHPRYLLNRKSLRRLLKRKGGRV